MDLPSDSEVDLYDSHIDPDYSPIQKNENSSRSLSDDEQIIGEPTVTTETDSEDAGSDKENFNHITKAIKNKKSVKSDMHWCVNKDNDFSKEPPVFEPKKNSDFIGETPLDYLYRLIPESYLEEMCFQSNLYTTQHGKENLNISMGERKVFIGINFMTTYVKYARLCQYWRLEARTTLKFLQTTKTVFIQLRPFFYLLHKTFHEARKPEESRSIDEMMVPFKGRSSLKQYIKSKPKPWGFKIWVRAGVPGYV
ncbi:hypothetical protein AVEN_243073-1 [Araneus ventricosus]|uniref:PiggyBac transposable element-derived protein domain-containing protein n=1 Tax=Araneus ventricosus TaxID=182803 RepID=A0A4Y2U9L6_ARAVE|nr:hypothetical protein AVEN_243073-1 [Araneus ventricosus]